MQEISPLEKKKRFVQLRLGLPIKYIDHLIDSIFGCANCMLLLTAHRQVKIPLNIHVHQLEIVSRAKEESLFGQLQHGFLCWC
jgi:hypothetical protein